MFQFHRSLIQSILVIVGLLALLVSPAFAQYAVHVVQRGDTLYRISQFYGVSAEELARANSLSSANHIYVGQELLIPVFDASADTVANPLVAGTPNFHTVQPGETLASIAAHYNLTMDQLARVNGIVDPNRIYVGQQLTVWTTQPEQPQANISGEPASAPTGITHTVEPGEQLWQIAQHYGVTWTAISQANGLVNPDRLLVGQQLFIPGVPSSDAPASPVADLGILVPAGPGATIAMGRQIIVDLSDQYIYAYEHSSLMHSTLVSTGLPGTPTVQGDYTVYVKHLAQTMTGPGYYLPDVPFVMYFYQGYAIHGTYWHNNFGQPMSHGCVNLPNADAEWFFNFAEVGTPVHVQW